MCFCQAEAARLDFMGEEVSTVSDFVTATSIINYSREGEMGVSTKAQWCVKAYVFQGTGRSDDGGSIAM